MRINSSGVIYALFPAPIHWWLIRKPHTTLCFLIIEVKRKTLAIFTESKGIFVFHFYHSGVDHLFPLFLLFADVCFTRSSVHTACTYKNYMYISSDRRGDAVQAKQGAVHMLFFYACLFVICQVHGMAKWPEADG